MNKEIFMKDNLLKTICYGLAVAMGIAVLVTNMISPLSLSGVTSLLAIGIAGLGISNLQQK